ncbi:MAG: radical SAM protein [Planctomycetaceae bacterium]
MKILFLEIDTERTWAVASMGPAFLAAYLRQHGHEVIGCRVPPQQDVEILIERIRGIDPQLIGVSLTTRQWLRARDLIGAVRQQVNVPVIAGGLHATFSPEAVLQHPGFDFVCLGEGEEALLELVNRLEAGEPTDDIRNIQVPGGSRPELRPPVESLDALPFLSRDLLDEQFGVVHISTQRGCPFPCTYCAARQFHDLYGSKNNYGRRRSVQSVMDELDEIQRTAELNYVIFLDDTFTIFPTWVEEFCHAHSERFGTPFSVHARADTVTPEMLQQLAGAGCRHIVYGVESGSLRVRREIMQRPITNERMIHTFRQTREQGIIVTANYMLGLPTETREDLEQTILLHEQLQPDDFGYFVFYPYPGTRLFHVCRDAGYLPDNFLELPANHRESILNLPNLTRADIAEYYDRFTVLREKSHLNRTSEPASADRHQQIVKEIQQCAATG